MNEETLIQLIERIQKAITQCVEFTDAEQEEYFVRLDVLRDSSNEQSQETLKRSLAHLADEPLKVRDYFAQMDETIASFLGRGTQGLEEQLDHATA